jgi:pSer/pThr/pTyr-binding forkhead associated (FHA) protein
MNKQPWLPQFDDPPAAPPAAAAPPPAGSPEPQCGWLCGEAAGPSPVPLDQPLIRVGRGDPASGYSPDLDIRSDDAVSRRHLEIRRTGDRFEILECGSTNGTFVNDEPLPPQHPRLLHHGDRIALGSRTLLFFTLDGSLPAAGQHQRGGGSSSGATGLSAPARQVEPEQVMTSFESGPVGAGAGFSQMMRGYDRETVDQCMQQLQDRLAGAEQTIWQLTEQLAEAQRSAGSRPAEAPPADSHLEAELEAARGQVREYAEREAAIHRALIVAQRAADEVRATAAAEAEQIRQAARAEAAALRADTEQAQAAARAELEAIAAQARRDADHAVSQARAQAEEAGRAAADAMAARLAELKALTERAETDLRSLEANRTALEQEWGSRLRGLLAAIERDPGARSPAVPAPAGEPASGSNA